MKVFTAEERDALPAIAATELRAGDVFIRAKGFRPIRCVASRVSSCGGFVHIHFTYESEYSSNRYPPSSMKSTRENMVRIVTTTTEKKEMTKLYQTKEVNPRFGTLLAFNSAGQAVLEMRPSGEIMTFSSSDIEVVRPYTVDVRFAGETTTYSYLSKPGAVKVGDVILIDNGAKMVFVKAIDTKSDKATKALRGRRMVTEEIVSPEDSGELL